MLLLSQQKQKPKYPVADAIGNASPLRSTSTAGLRLHGQHLIALCATSALMLSTFTHQKLVACHKDAGHLH